MFHLLRQCLLVFVVFSASTIAGEGRTIRVAQNPALSPDGSQVVFAWAGELWSATLEGTQLTRLTNHPADDRQPMFSPDGHRLAFVSNRTGSEQLYVMNSDGTDVRQVTFHSAGFQLADWFPDGNSLLAIGERDHFWRGASRLIRVSVDQRRAEEVLFDGTASDAKVSPDGEQILFTREGERWWRKGYQGERASQVWHLNLATGQCSEVLHEGVDCRWPIWHANGKGFYFAKGDIHGFDLWSYQFPAGKSADAGESTAFSGGKQRAVAKFKEDSVVFPSISRDGKVVVFRHLFDLYAWKPAEKKRPSRIELSLTADFSLPANEMRREFDEVEEVAFTDDGLDIAMIAGGDVWIMDTKLREPKRVTSTAGYEKSLVFSNDGKQLYFTSTEAGQTDIWQATRSDSEQYWWQNDEFELKQLTHSRAVESSLQLTPDGKQLVFQEGRGNLAAMSLDDGQLRTLVEGFSRIDFDISPDSQWLAYEKQDDDFNSDVWLQRLNGDEPPVNVSRHPDNDGNPKFSPDGKLLAFTGRRIEDEVDIYYVYLNEADDEKTSRERKIEEALELMKKQRKPVEPKVTEKAADQPVASDDSEKQKSADEEKTKDDSADSGVPSLVIDLDRIHERLRKISIPNSYEGSLVFSPDGKKLAFNASIDGKRGWYTVEFPDELSPKLLSTSTGAQAVWSKKAGGILYLQNGRPAKLEPSGKLETFSLKILQSSSRGAWLQAGFDEAWLAMREAWYDERFANRNWDAVRRKYSPVAAEMTTTSELAEVVHLMLGELNGSHLGFYPASTSSSGVVEGWRDETAHLGVRFQPGFNGPGLRVRDVLRNGPADREGSRLQANDVVLTIDETPVDPEMDLTELLNGRLDRDILLCVTRAGDDETQHELDIKLRPISYSQARSLLYDQWLEGNRSAVDELSEGRLGYLHIRAMDMNSFYEFEEQLYQVGYGKDGLVIDVRDNGGGSTTDLLLTSLTQPRHAITVPRGGGSGYPHDRMVYATWSKPIIVLCNQNSYSNAEIFSHAIKYLGRGKIVGVTTAGGVVSTGSANIIDVGRLRIPFRGWFLLGTGEDMELNGCVPDVVIWPAPGELPQGIDRQLEKGVEMLLQEVADVPALPKLKYASERE